MAGKRRLVAFDFDQTVVEGNTDTHIHKLAPNGLIPSEIRFNRSECWTDHMAKIFAFIHSHGVSADDYLNCLASLPLTDGMGKFINRLKADRNTNELLIISDSNSEFIRMSLQHHSLSDAFHSVITNPAKFASNGCLEIAYCHKQDWCQLCTDNMCKGHLLTEYVAKRRCDGVEFGQILYVGDGTGDFCAGLKLAPADVFAVRKGFSLDSMLKGDEQKRSQLKSKVFYWDSAEELNEIIT